MISIARHSDALRGAEDQLGLIQASIERAEQKPPLGLIRLSLA
jgi:hypothetical protein